jgi:hypothetical protein
LWEEGAKIPEGKRKMEKDKILKTKTSRFFAQGSPRKQ